MIFFSNVHSEEEPPSGEPEEIALTFSAKSFKRSLVDCFYYKDETYIPLKKMLDMFMIQSSLNPADGIIEGTINGKDDNFKIDFGKHSIQIRDKEIEFTGNDFLNIEGEYYLKPSLFLEGFGMNFRINMNKLSMMLIADESLPIYRNIKRESIRRTLETKNKETTSFTFKRERSILNGGFLDYNLSSNHKQKKEPNYSYNLSLGSEVLGGDLFANVNGSLNNTNSNESFNSEAMWRYVADNRILNQVVLGSNLSSQGILSAQYRGGMITNAPYGVRNDFSKYVLVDRTIPESDVELYINNELVDYTTANEFGDFSFDIPLNYGTTIIDLKIYSPTGELIEDNRKIQIPFDLLPDKEFQYTISGGLRNGLNTKALNGSLAFGFTSWLTNKVGVDYLEDSLFNKPVLYNSLSGRISDNYLFNITAAPDLYYRFNFNASYVGQQSVNFRYTKYRQNDSYNYFGLVDEFILNSSLPFTLWARKHSFRIGGTYGSLEDGKRYGMDASAEFSVWKLNPSISYNYREDRSTPANHTSKYITAGINVPLLGLEEIPFFSNRYIKAKLTYDLINKNTSLINLSYSHRIFKHFRMQVNYARDFMIGTDFFNIAFQYDLPFAQANVVGYKDRIDANLNGSIGFDGTMSRIISTKRKSVGTSGVSINMFEDINGNGKYDEGEIQIDDANIKFSKNVKVEREDNGMLSAGFLSQYVNYEFNMNRLSGKHPLLVPKYDNVMVETDPNSYKYIEIPFYETEEVFGYVVADKDGKTVPLSNVRINIKEKNSDKKTSLETFSDGSIYYMGLLPGEYTAELDTAQLNKMGLVSIPGKIDFAIGDADRKMSELNFIVNSENIIQETENELLADTVSTETVLFTVQLGAFRYYQNVLRFSNTLKTDLLIELYIKEFPDGLYKILSGEFNNADDARQFVSFVKERGFDAFIRRVESDWMNP